MKDYRVIAIGGESGTGKDTVLKHLSSLPLEFNTIISHTTRPIREGEVDGIDYYYTTEEEFENLDLLEMSHFNGWYYGTSMAAMSKDKVNVGVFDPTGIRNLANRMDIDLKIIRLRAPGDVRLLRQLTRTENPDVKEIVRRYQTDTDDFKAFDDEYRAWYHMYNNVSKFDLEIIRVEIGRQIKSME